MTKQLATGVNGESLYSRDGAADAPCAQAQLPEDAVVTARCVVAEYLHDLGLLDPDLIARESRQLVERARLARAHPGTGDEVSLPEAAIHLTVQQLDQWLLALSGKPGDKEKPGVVDNVVGTRLPRLLTRMPEALQQRHPPAELVDELRKDLTAVVPQPRPRPMRQQRLALISPALMRFVYSTARFLSRQGAPPDVEPAAPASKPTLLRVTPVRVILVLLTLLSTVVAVRRFCHVVAGDGFGWLDVSLASLFAILFLWIAWSFWMATFGFVVLLRRPRPELAPAQPADTPAELPHTAILMPVYNEDPRKVFLNLRAISDSLSTTGHDGAFSIFVLSDTTNPDVWLEEERAWAQLVVELPSGLRIFYRHRPTNNGRKAGNIADFCSRWGEHYKYMIILDADSVMAGETLVEMVRRLEADPEIGILQVPPRPVNRQSFFARMQQFAAAAYGPVFLEGFTLWSQCDGNYWGHNAIIRIQPFMEHCDLPVLPGDGPLSGEILSHDFVEAALMRRAGWKVCLAHDLDGSYEECPTTMLDFAERDQRWCQGNLQHIRLLLADGFHPISRLHLSMGVMSYLASPLWLLSLLLTLLGAVLGGDRATGNRPVTGVLLFVVTMAILLLPKLWGLILLARHRSPGNGGVVWDRAWASALIEILVSCLIAPIMMLLHSRFVISTLLGKKVKWNAQQRDDRGVSLGDACAIHFPHTLVGLGLGGLVWFLAPEILPWVSPVLLGPVLSIPLAMLLGSVAIGRSLARGRLLLIPEEVAPPAVLKFQHEASLRAELENAADGDHAALFGSVLRDPTFYALHVGILRATESDVPMSAEQLQRAKVLLAANVLRNAPTEVRRAVLCNARALETLHVMARCVKGSAVVRAS